MAQYIKPNARVQRRAIFIDDISKQVVFSDDLLELEKQYENEEEEEDDDDKIIPLIQEENAEWLPALGYSMKFDGHTFIAGATESGKSFFIKRMIMNDKLHRPVILFTNLTGDDVSFRGIQEMTKFDPNSKYNWEWVLQNYANRILIFDDIRNNTIIKNFKDKMIEEGRHSNTVVICVNHALKDWNITKVAHNDCRFIVTFPSSNRGHVRKYLKDDMGLSKKQLNRLMKVSNKEGRYLILHKFTPNAIATTESIFKL